MKRYAEGTGVPVWKTKAAIDEQLRQRGTLNRAIAETEDAHGKPWAVVQFDLTDMAGSSRRVRFKMPLPMRSIFVVSVRGKARSPEAVGKLHEQASREAWRALLLAIKSKFVNADTGVETIEEAFLVQTVTPDGKTFAEHALPALKVAYATGKLPPLLGPGSTS